MPDFQSGDTSSSLVIRSNKKGVVVQLAKAGDCLSSSCGFESRLHRKKNGVTCTKGAMVLCKYCVMSSILIYSTISGYGLKAEFLFCNQEVSVRFRLFAQ